MSRRLGATVSVGISRARNKGGRKRRAKGGPVPPTGTADASQASTELSLDSMPPIKIRLPSGQIATLRKPAAARPWQAFREGSVYVVRRVKRGDSSEWEIFANQGSLTPLCLDLTDAEALVTALNAEWPAVTAPERQNTTV